jgi:hypothetical protein
VYNIRKAVSRLEFAPGIDEVKITDVQKGLGGFTPKPEKAVSFAALKEALKKAGYKLGSADIIVTGVLEREGDKWWLVADSSKQRFLLLGEHQALASGARVEVQGSWETQGEKDAAREVIRLRTAEKVAARRRPFAENVEVAVIEGGVPMTPIRTTSPGLTVYKGGAVVPRYLFTQQHLGSLKIDRHAVRLTLTYTPTPTLQLEAEIPCQKSSFRDGTREGSGHGWGNVILWGKYRFFRTLETWGDQQAAVRFGLELPTGKKDAPTEAALPLPEFVRQQLTPISGGLSSHVDASYSQARGRFVYGASVEGIARSERSGFRLGHELRVNTDLEYVLLPLKYQSPTNELFLIFETTYVHRTNGRASGRVVSDTGSNGFYVAPALQYVPTARFLIEVSYQVPVIERVGPQVLRTDRNILIGIRYLY